ncbi:MAG: DUF4416 family protein [Candidatus Omnitrophica bacterium]|nr:DUF4416 family protein [Candidatus Omnitrophota bacterium]
MGKIERPPLVKLIIGFIFNQENYLLKAKKLLIKKFGKIDFESEILDFNYTDYYQKEMGGNLKRKFISFEKLISPSKLTSIKRFTNRIEEKLSKDKKRNVNIDPGYINLSKLVLASTKDYRHRIYLNKGIFAEVTLFYQNKSFSPLPWTYPDYKTYPYIEIFNYIRELYKKQIKNK